MHTYHSARIILAGLLVFLFADSLAAQTINPSDLLNPRDVPADFYGFNGEYMIDQCLNTDDPRTNPPQPLNTLYLDQTCRLLVDELNPGLIRFPGGTTANYYHFNGKGYGYNEEETFLTEIGAQELGFDGLMPVNFIELFADLAIQTNSKVIFTINIFTHFKAGGSAVDNPASTAYQNRFQENMAAISYLMNRGVDLVGIELGNELYTYAEFTSIFTIGTAIDKYLTLAGNYANAIKLSYPNLKIGVPVAIHAGYGNLRWNEKMQEAEFADGVIPHEYERKVYSSCDPEAGQSTYFDCARSTVELFFDTDFEAAVTEYMQLYPNHEIWLTEWGMSQPQGVANTLFDAYFVFKYWNKIMEIEKAYPGRVTYTNRHNLVTGGYLYSAFGNQLIQESSDVLYLDDKAIRATAYSSLLMKDIFDGTHKFVGKTTIGDCSAWIYTQGAGNFKLAVINGNDADTTFTIAALNNLLGETNLEFSEISNLSAEEFHSAAGINYYGTGSSGLGNNLNFISGAEAIDRASMNIPSNSLNVITVTPAEVEPFALNDFNVQENNCELTFNWSVTSDAPTLQYAISMNGEPFDVLNSNGFSVTASYEHSVTFDETGDFIFELSAVENGSDLGSLSAPEMALDCTPVPDPSITTITQSTDENCVLQVFWNVDNDHAAATYHVAIEQDGHGEIFSEPVASDGSGSYSSSYQLTTNGSYTSSVYYEWPEGGSSPVSSTTLDADCIIPPASVASAELLATPNCSYSLNWTVSNETGSSSYNIYVSNNGSSQLLASLPSSGSSSSEAYSLPFDPQSNGVYSFSLEHFIDDQLVSTTGGLIAEVSCISPAISNASFTVNDLCEIVVEWTIENDQAGAEFNINLGLPGGDLQPSATIISDGNGSYDLSQPAAVNGEHLARIDLTFNGNDLQSSGVLSTTVGCISVPAPAVELFTITDNEDCSYSLNWTVSNETGSSSYNIYVSNNGSSQLLASLPSSGSSSSEAYSLPFDPQSNGVYSFSLEHFIDDQLVSTTGGLIAEVSCISPAISNASFAVNDLCEIVVEWTIENDQAGAEFNINLGLPGGDLQPSATIISDGNGSYDLSQPAAINGEHLARIDLSFNGNDLQSSGVLSTTVGCISAPAPAVELFTITDNEDCSYSLNWTVSNETGSSSYNIYVSNNGSSQLLGSLPSSGSSSSEAYSLPFNPQSNGVYSFNLEHYTDDQLVSTTGGPVAEVTCIAPSLSNTSFTVNALCELVFNWTVENDQPGTEFIISFAAEGNELEVVSTVLSDGGGAYSQSGPASENGEYLAQLDVVHNGNSVESSNVLSVTVACIDNPAPALETFTLTENEDCSYSVNWTVSNETILSSYNLYVSNNGVSQLLGSLSSLGSAPSAEYYLPFDPASNGTYSFSLEHYIEEQLVNTPGNMISEVACFAPSLSNTSFSVNAACEVEWTWTVENDQPGAAFVLSFAVEGAELQTISTIMSNGSGSYAIPKQASANGEHLARIDLLFDGSDMGSSGLLSTTVNCINNLEPVVEQFTPTDLEDCSYSLNWTVSNENASSRYELFVSQNGNSQLLADLPSSGVSESADYSTDFTPVSNGTYGFYLEHYLDGQLAATTDELLIDVACILPAFTGTSFTVTGSCETLLTWTVEKDQPGTEFSISTATASGALQEVAIVASDGSGSYSYTEPVLANGAYFASIDLSFGENLLESSGTLSTLAACVPDPDPAIEMFTLADNENCTYTLNWEVSNESAGAGYEVVVSYNGGTEEIVANLSSSESSEVASYQYYFVAEANGIYEFVVRRIDNGQVQSSTEALSLSVSCIPDPYPAFVSYQPTFLSPCSYRIEWTVSNEDAGGVYVVKKSRNGGAFSTVATIYSVGETSLAHYQYIYNPAENGEYRFRIERLKNGALTASTGFMAFTIDCVEDPDPEITSFSLDQAGACAYVLRWNTSNESASGYYRILASSNGSGFEEFAIVQTQGELSSAHYIHPFEPEANGNYVFTIHRMIDGAPVAVSNIISYSITCFVEVPAEIETLHVVESDQCTHLVTWSVSNETDNGSYKIISSLNGSDFDVSEDILSSGAASHSVYQYEFEPEEDGNYILAVQRYESDVFQTISDVEVIDAFCNTNTQFSAIQVTEFECEIGLFWTVYNETSNGIYSIWKSIDGSPFELAGTMPSLQSSISASYQFHYDPETNGTYEWKVIRSEIQQQPLTSETVSVSIECISASAPVIESFIASLQGSCALFMTWIVSNEVADGSYSIYQSVDGGESTLLASLESNGEMETSSYLYITNPTVNGTYEFRLERNGNSPVSFAEYIIDVNCLEDPAELAIEWAEVSFEDECHLQINWEASGQSVNDEFLVYGAKKGELMQLLHTAFAGEETEQSYSFPYQAPVNGHYGFRIEAWSDGELADDTRKMNVYIDCSETPQQFAELTVSPTITAGPFQVKAKTVNASPAEIRIVHTATGAIALQENIFLEAGNNHFSYNMDQFSGATTGLYSVILIVEGEIFSTGLMYTN